MNSKLNEIHPGYSSDSDQDELKQSGHRSRICAMSNAEHLWIVKIYLNPKYPVEIIYKLENRIKPDLEK